MSINLNTTGIDSLSGPKKASMGPKEQLEFFIKQFEEGEINVNAFIEKLQALKATDINSNVMKFQEGDTLKVTTVVDFSIFGRSYHVTQYLSLTKSEEIPLTPQNPTLSGDEILSMQSVSDYQKSCAESLSSEEKIAYYQIYNKISNY